MVTYITMTGIRNVKDYHVGCVNKNSVELHKDTMSRCSRTDNVRTILWYSGETIAYCDYSDAGSGVRK
jgi:hypothetical protein